MRLGLNIGYSGSALGMDLPLIEEADRLGFHSVCSAEAYGSDAVSIPDALGDEIALCGPRERIEERLSRWTASGVTTMICGMGQVEALRTMAELVL